MARSVNQVILLGNLTRDPEVRQTPSGQSVCSFSLALNRAYKAQNGEWQEATDYIDVVAWGPLGERVGQYLSKGRRALVQGRIQSRSWEQDGQKRNKVEVLANDVTFLDGREGGEGSSSGSAGAGGNYSRGDSAGGAQGGSSNNSSNKKQDDAADDMGDEPINLDDIPF
jgi:single-strand DNA-binding protein